ncbi:hypothetical protein N1031_06910 [Herbiconiux moechotypicola]|uniref:Major capsid protein n=1 Tax=Herbiconiux moechotypicola TaxID=637393 RepID=A0ABN3DG66_9MICO|nr:P22 phage major capsid protein family protein [Herbiconiux moechotypicola]MCS5729486.1 hypothetical protein [Herbiconiux moechotypicola]
MPNTFVYTAPQVAQVAASLVQKDSELSALVSKNYVSEFLGEGTGGRPIAIKQPTTLIARSRTVDDVTSSIVLDQIAEATTTVNLSKTHDYSAVGLSEADLTLNLTDFSAQVLKPQAEAIVDSLEHKVATALLAVPLTTLTKPDGADAGTDPDVVVFDPANPIPYITRIRKWLRDNGVPQSGMQMIVGTEVYAALLDAKAITDASESASSEALREGGVGRIRGFNIVESNRVPADEILAFHRDAVTLVTRAPAVPAGASFGASVSEKGFSLRYLRDYDATKTQDRSIVSTFSGVGILPTYKIERDYDTRTVSTTALPNGGVIHLDTAA